MASHIGRRKFLAALLGEAAAWPLAARAQQGERVRRIGVLMSVPADDRETQARHAAFLQGLQQLGWTDGRNARIEFRGATDADHIRQYAAELVALAPDLILSSGTAVAGPLLQATRTVPIVFVQVADPVGAGFVESLSRPGGNATGFSVFEYSMSGKWLELIKEIVPSVKRVAVIRDPSISAGPAQFAAIQVVAPSFGVELSPLGVGDASEIEHTLGSFAPGSNGGLIVTASALALAHRDLITTLAARHKLPAVYFQRPFVAGGGLISYGQSQVSTMKLTDTLQEQEALERLIEETKFPVPEDCRHLGFLLFTPFRYKPYPADSRFRRAGSTEGVFYAAEVVETAVAEAVFHRLLFYWESPDIPWPTNPGEYTAFATEFATGRAVDLSHPPLVTERASWTHLMDYTACLDLADVIRAAALEAIRYESVRDPQSRANLALLTCRVFTQNDVVDRQTWHFHFTNSGVRSIREAPSATIQFDRNVFAADPRIAAMKWDRASESPKQAGRLI